MSEIVHVARRLGTVPAERGGCTASGNCPDVFETEQGDIAMIGFAAVLANVPPDAVVVNPDGVIVIPRDVMLAAVRQLREEET